MTEEPLNIIIEYSNKKGVKGILKVWEEDGILKVHSRDDFPDGKFAELEYETDRYNKNKIIAKYNQIRRFTKDKEKHVAVVLATILSGE